MFVIYNAIYGANSFPLVIFDSMLLTLRSDGAPIGNVDQLTWPKVGSVVLVAVILWLVSLLVGLLYLMASCLTFGLLVLAYPLVGWLTLVLTAHFMPGSLALHGFWITLLCGFLLMIVKIHPPKRRTTVAATAED